MIDPHALIASRKFGALRYAVLSESTHDMARVLARFGLRPEPLLLFEQSRETATEMLVELLWKDLVGHDIEWMSRAGATSLAGTIITEHAFEESKFFSNRKWPMDGDWNGFTESTFDSGLIITGKNGAYFCFWVEDED